MDRLTAALACFAFATATSLPAIAQTGTVTLTVSGVKTAKGSILANLCGDEKAPFPGPCLTHSATAEAKEGTTVLIFDGVAPGRYASRPSMTKMTTCK